MSGVISLDFLPLSEVKKETDLDQTSQDQITNQDQTSDQDQIIDLDQTFDQSPTSEDQTSEDKTSEDQTYEDETAEDQTVKNQITAQDQTSNQDQTTDLLTQQAALMLFLEEKVLIDCEEEEEDLISAMLLSFIGSLEDNEWQSLQERMVVQMSQTHLAQASERIIRVVSQLVLQLLAPSLKVQFQPEDLPRASPSESEEEEEEEEEHLRKYLRIDEEALVRSLGSSASQLSARSMGDLVKQLNQGLCLLAAQSQDSAETEGSEVTPAVMKFLALAGETLAHLRDEDQDQDQDVDTISKRATEEVMFAIADTMAMCQVEGRKSTKILRDLATKISEQCSASDHQQLSSFTISLKMDSDNQAEQPGVPAMPYPIHVLPEKINSDLSEFLGSCLQVLKGLLAKLLALSSPQSFSMMTAPHRSSLPSLESAASDILDIVVNSVKELCQKKKSKFPLRRRKTKIKEKKVNSTATELKVALQEKLGEFLTCHKDAVEQQKKDKMEKARMIVSTLLSDLRQKTAECEDMQQEQRSRVQVVTSAVRTLLQQVDICGGDRDRSTLVKLEDLISEDKLSSFSQLLTSSLGPLWSNSVSPAEQVRLFCTAAVKYLLRLFVLPPLSWGMGRVVQVQSDKSSTARLAESAQLYDDIISRYAQLMSDQVMSSLRRSSTAFWLQLEVDVLQDGLKTDNGAPTKKKKRRNVIHFFQKLPRKVGKKWRTLRNRMDTYIMDGDSDDEEEGLDPSELRRRRISRFLHNLSDRIVMAFWVYEPRPWQTMALFPI
ncbi:uncharacterized protein AKAME5_000515300 [Lates japonicus]|uniref:Uncharacterized protein n=1 Tax=Lates japonicus TaxID=270547 RepID=A0AAD3ME55_LATJO|nr:uncharacterized protein AKAME5_000515300 [Lates japonicus]